MSARLPVEYRAGAPRYALWVLLPLLQRAAILMGP
jgi:hypothetical protein